LQFDQFLCPDHAIDHFDHPPPRHLRRRLF
jgi:hypothetical protein